MNTSELWSLSCFDTLTCQGCGQRIIQIVPGDTRVNIDQAYHNHVSKCFALKRIVVNGKTK